MLLKAALVLAVLSAAPLEARARGWGLDRVDLLAEDPGFFLNYELPAASSYATRPLLRLAEQVKPVWTTPWPGLSIGTSLASQSLVYEHGLGVRGLSWSAGIQAQTLLPRGLVGGLAYRIGVFRLAAGISVVSGAAWSWLGGYRFWRVLPTVGLGIGRAPQDDSGAAE